MIDREIRKNQLQLNLNKTADALLAADSNLDKAEDHLNFCISELEGAARLLAGALDRGDRIKVHGYPEPIIFDRFNKDSFIISVKISPSLIRGVPVKHLIGYVVNG